MLSAYEECWPNAKLDYNIELLDKYPPQGYDPNNETHAGYLQHGIEKADNKISTSPKNYATQVCNSRRAQSFSPEEEDAIHYKIKYKMEQLEEQDYIRW